MSEQERPRTEAGRRLLEGDFIEADYDGCNIDTGALLEGILAIEAEGRQQAVREIADTLTDHSDHLPITSDGENLRCSPDDAVLVAGLNASEPPLCPDCGNDMRYAGHPVPWRRCGDASESARTLPQHFIRAGQLPEVGDASESGQLPEQRCEADDAGKVCGRHYEQKIGCPIHGYEAEHRGHRILVNGHGNRWCHDCETWVYLRDASESGQLPDLMPHTRLRRNTGQSPGGQR